MQPRRFNTCRSAAVPAASRHGWCFLLSASVRSRASMLPKIPPDTIKQIKFQSFLRVHGCVSPTETLFTLPPSDRRPSVLIHQRPPSPGPSLHKPVPWEPTVVPEREGGGRGRSRPSRCGCSNGFPRECLMKSFMRVVQGEIIQRWHEGIIHVGR